MSGNHPACQRDGCCWVKVNVWKGNGGTENQINVLDKVATAQ